MPKCHSWLVFTLCSALLSANYALPILNVTLPSKWQIRNTITCLPHILPKLHSVEIPQVSSSMPHIFQHPCSPEEVSQSRNNSRFRWRTRKRASKGKLLHGKFHTGSRAPRVAKAPFPRVCVCVWGGTTWKIVMKRMKAEFGLKTVFNRLWEGKGSLNSWLFCMVICKFRKMMAIHLKQILSHSMHIKNKSREDSKQLHLMWNVTR